MRGGLPEPLLDRLEKQFGKGRRDAIVAAFRVQRLPTFRVNTLKTTDEVVMAALREDGIAFERVKGVPHALRIKNRSDRELLDHALAQSGKVYLQGVASMLPPLVLAPEPGERVLDLCAAPGSKTTQMAALMKGEGRIVACEENEIRFQKLTNTLAMQGATMVEARHMDATRFEGETFDRVLVDASCSAEGRIDLNDPRSYGFWSEKNIVAHAKLQRRLLRAAVRALKPGGRLVYSTCTLAPAENEEMAAWLKSAFPDLKPFAFDLPIPETKRWAPNAITVLPTKDYEGLFVAAFYKQG